MIHLLGISGHGQRFVKEMDRINKIMPELNIGLYATDRATPKINRWMYVCEKCNTKHNRSRRLDKGGVNHRCECGGSLKENKLDEIDNKLTKIVTDNKQDIDNLVDDILGKLF